MRKILLINPPETEQTGFTSPPLGLLYLAGTLSANNIDVKLIDGCIHGWSGINDILMSYSPDIVGITCLTPMRKKALTVASMAKKIKKNTKIVLGGAHPTIMPRQILEHYNDIDVVVCGEGELSFLEIVQGHDPDKIKGIVYRNGDKLIKTPNRCPVDDLDKLPFPAWDMIADTLYKYPSNAPIASYNSIDLRNFPRISVIYSRGCIGRCDFCSTWWIWKGWRHRSAKNMTDEIEWLYKSFNIRHFNFADDTLTVNRQATLELCDEIVKRRLKIAFYATTRADCVDLEMLEKLKAAGCYEISYGIETVSPSLLRGMNKEEIADTAQVAIALAKRAGLRACALLIAGNVGETEETIDETIDFLQKTNPEGVGTVGGLWILPGTALYRRAKKLGIISDDFWLGDAPYLVYTHEHSLSRLRFFTHAIKQRKKISEMTTGYRMAYVARDLAQTVSMRLDKYPMLKSFLKKFYLPIKHIFRELRPMRQKD